MQEGKTCREAGAAPCVVPIPWKIRFHTSYVIFAKLWMYDGCFVVRAIACGGVGGANPEVGVRTGGSEHLRELCNEAVDIVAAVDSRFWERVGNDVC